MARRIRRLFLDLGYTFVSTPVGHSNVFSLLALAYYLDEKKVSYKANAALLADMAPTLGEVITSYHLVKIEIGSNNLLHETAHCVAHERLFGGGSPFESFDGANRTEVVLRHLCGEAFAQSVEVLNLVYFISPESSYYDLVCVKWNSFVNAKPALVQELRTLVDAFGAAPALCYLVGCFLLHNYKQDGLTDERAAALTTLMNLVCEESDLDAARFHELAPSATAYVFSFGQDFIHFTTPMFYRFLGMEGPYSVCLELEPLSAVVADPGLVASVRQLIVDAVGA